MTSNIIPAKPSNMSVFRPAFSIIAKETTVINTFIPPIPKVAYCEVSAVRPADMKMSVE